MAISKDFKQLIFFDIETVSSHKSYDDLNDRMQKLWNKKSAYLKSEDTPEQTFQERAGIYAEFGKIIVISIGMFYEENDELKFRVKAFHGDDEKEIIKQLFEVLSKNKNYQIVAHNGKEFDIPYICRRALINGVSLPHVLQFEGKKPWEINHIDTLQLWRFGDWKSFTSLDLLAAVFDIPTSKDDIDGSQVSNVYYTEGGTDRIAHYCMKDVVVTARLYQKYKGIDYVSDENIQWISN